MILSLWADAAVKIRLAEVTDENSRLRLALDAKQLECDLQGELLETYRKQVQCLLAQLTVHGRMLGMPEK